MNDKDDEIQRLKSKFTELSSLIDLLMTKKKEAEIAAKKFGQELDQLRSKQHAISQELHRLETSNSNMWENIGEGG